MVAIPFSRGFFPTQGLNLGLLHCRWILYDLSYQGGNTSTWIKWVNRPYIFLNIMISFLLALLQTHKWMSSTLCLQSYINFVTNPFDSNLVLLKSYSFIFEWDPCWAVGYFLSQQDPLWPTSQNIGNKSKNKQMGSN